MREPFPNKTLSEAPSENRLDSWKEIATYLGRDVTTVQRWRGRRECRSTATCTTSEGPSMP